MQIQSYNTLVSIMETRLWGRKSSREKIKVAESMVGKKTTTATINSPRVLIKPATWAILNRGKKHEPQIFSCDILYLNNKWVERSFPNQNPGWGKKIKEDVFLYNTNDQVKKTLLSTTKAFCFLIPSAVPFYKNYTWTRKKLKHKVVWFWGILGFWMELYL